ncbi:hypothetical protein FRB95_007177 [Tulasnella sp. JGI-2019a]|nr:hypothetical protein FRB95_007177 [Tulasnella sp. JGI-2019a]
MLTPLTSIHPSTPPKSWSRQKRDRRAGGFYESLGVSRRAGGVDENHAPCVDQENERPTYRFEGRQKASHSTADLAGRRYHHGGGESSDHDPMSASRSFSKAKRFFETISRSNTSVRPEDNNCRSRSKSSTTSDDKNRIQKILGSIGKAKANSSSPTLSPRCKDIPHPGRVLGKLAKSSKLRSPLNGLVSTFADHASPSREKTHQAENLERGLSDYTISRPAYTPNTGYRPSHNSNAQEIFAPLNLRHADPPVRPVLLASPNTVSFTTIRRRIPQDYDELSNVSITTNEADSSDLEDWSASTYDGDPFGLELHTPRSPSSRSAWQDIPSRPRTPLPPQLMESITLALEEVSSLVAKLGSGHSNPEQHEHEQREGSYRTTSEIRGSMDDRRLSDYERYPLHSCSSLNGPTHPTMIDIVPPPYSTTPTNYASQDSVQPDPATEDPIAAPVISAEVGHPVDAESVDGTPLEEDQGTPLPSDLTVWWIGEGEYYAFTSPHSDLNQFARELVGEVEP